MHSTSNAGGKTGRGRGWKLDYLKFRGNYEGNYRENLFLDPIVHRGERSTIRSSRKTSATREIGALAPVRFFVRSPRWNPCDGLAPNSFRTTWLRSPPVPLRDCYVIRFVLRLSPSRETFLLLTRIYSERSSFICSILFPDRKDIIGIIFFFFYLYYSR